MLFQILFIQKGNIKNTIKIYTNTNPKYSKGHSSGSSGITNPMPHNRQIIIADIAIRTLFG